MFGDGRGGVIDFPKFNWLHGCVTAAPSLILVLNKSLDFEGFDCQGLSSLKVHRYNFNETVQILEVSSVLANDEKKLKIC